MHEERGKGDVFFFFWVGRRDVGLPLPTFILPFAFFPTVFFFFFLD